MAYGIGRNSSRPSPYANRALLPKTEFIGTQEGTGSGLSREFKAAGGIASGFFKGILEMAKDVPRLAPGGQAPKVFTAETGKAILESFKDTVTGQNLMDAVRGDTTWVEWLVEDLGNVATVFGAGAAVQVGRASRIAKLAAAAEKSGDVARATLLRSQAAELAQSAQGLRKVPTYPVRKGAEKFGKAAREAAETQGTGVQMNLLGAGLAKAGRGLHALDRTKDAKAGTQALRAQTDEAGRDPYIVARAEAAKRLAKTDRKLSVQEADRLIGEELQFRGEALDAARKVGVAGPVPVLRQRQLPEDVSRLVDEALPLRKAYHEKYGVQDLDPKAKEWKPSIAGEKARKGAESAAERAAKLREKYQTELARLHTLEEEVAGAAGVRLKDPKAFGRTQVRSEGRSQQRVADANKGLHRLKVQIAAADREVARSLERAATFEDKLLVSRAPAHFKPLVSELLKGRTRLIQDAKAGALTAEDAAAVLEGVPDTISGTLRLMDQLGLEPPQHFRDFSQAQARAYASGSKSLGSFVRGPTKTVEAGTRKDKRLLLRRKEGPSEIFGAATTTIEAEIALAAEVAHEAVSNGVVQKLLETSVPIPESGLIPQGWVQFSPDSILTAPATVHSAEIRRIAGIQVNGQKMQQIASQAKGRMIPRATQQSIDKLFGQPWSGMIPGGLVTDQWRAALLYHSPRWLVNNTFGNTMLASLELGVGIVNPRTWADAIRSSKTRVRIADDLDVKVPFADVPADVVGSGIHMERVERGLGRTPMAKVSRRVNEVTDNFFRSMVYHRKARKGAILEGIDADALHAKVAAGEALTPAEDAVVRNAVKRATKSLVDYGDSTPFERSVIRRFVPFYAWQKGILKLTLSLPVDDPLRFAALEQISNHFGGFSKEEREAYPEYLVPTANVFGHHIGTAGMNPFADAMSLINPSEGGLMDQLAPIPGAGLRFISRHAEQRFGPQEVGKYGRPEPQVGLDDIALDTLKGLPQVRLLLEEDKGNEAAALMGLRLRSPEQMGAAAAREQNTRRDILLRKTLEQVKGMNIPYDAMREFRRKQLIQQALRRNRESLGRVDRARLIEPTRLAQ